MCDCGISTTSQTRPFCKHCFSATYPRSIKHRQWKHKLNYCGVVFAHLATWCGIKAKDLLGLDSDRWIPHSRCCENFAPRGILAPPLSGIHRSESSTSGSFTIKSNIFVIFPEGAELCMQLFYRSNITPQYRAIRAYCKCHLIPDTRAATCLCNSVHNPGSITAYNGSQSSWAILA